MGGPVLPILVALFTALMGGLYLLGMFRRQRPGEPPLDKGLLPWLGHVLEFRRNMFKFLRRMQEKHGEVFTVQLSGFYVTFLQDPLSFGPFVKESREKLDFNKYAKQLVHRVFGYWSPHSEHHHLQQSSNKYLKGDGLEVLTQAMTNNLQDLMLHDLGKEQRAWTEDGLFMYCYNIVFRAGYLALYGNVSPKSEDGLEKAKEKDRVESEALFYKFRAYDQLFPNLTYGILPPKKKLEARGLLEYFWDTLAVHKVKTKDNTSGWVWEMQQVREEMGMDKAMIDRYMLLLLWASQSNTGPSAFWLLMYIMKNPDAMAAVTAEVDRIVRESGQEVKRGGPLLNVTYEMLLKTTVMDSVVEETLRLRAAPLLVRGVLQDMSLKMADGREFLIRKGDRVATFPYTCVHTDPGVHPDPLTFKYDRFLNPDGNKKTEFYKDGKKVKYYTMPWGAGVSICPGRFFANNELKQFIFLMLVYFEFELLDPKTEVPEIDVRRWGFGTMHPDREVPFRYRLRY
ncbi:5-beta-cholestane-3-alpha,7-alpha-diol 12-alpha-hydroxylase-like [Syngnathus acus]|uniref:5-beta-cholestane-3-alpha,7-alpha-diol 12-alpha-hydroxylase-like n=1 Tax=Syngnathus acus TaxID=161584 RepID=UPI00188638B1|nr:5-beta-cholestane-3-alpha,7-alpha-diol 12-alpha-hydroxylase-like [Syngnathus acus]